MNPDVLRDLLDYKRTVLEQLLTVSSIFGGFAVTGVVALRAEARRDRLHGFAMLSLSIAAIAFIFATALDAVWLPVSRLERLRDPLALRAVLDVGEAVVWAVMVGAASLLAAVGSFGFTRSRVVGVTVLVLALIATAAFVACVLALARAT